MYTFISYVEKSFEALVKILKDLNRGAEKGFVLGLHKQYAQLFLVEGIKMGLRKFLPPSRNSSLFLAKNLSQINCYVNSKASFSIPSVCHMSNIHILSLNYQNFTTSFSFLPILIWVKVVHFLLVIVCPYIS